MSKFSLIIPCYNEEDVLKLTYEKLIEHVPSITDSYEIIFIDDGSSDNTLDILKEFAKTNKNIKIISFSRNFGQQNALYAGLESSSGDYIGFIDADLQDPPEILADMLKTMLEQNAEVIYGQRLKRENETWLKKFTSKTYYRIFNYLSDLKVPVDTSDFRIISRKIANEVLKMKECDMYFRGMVTYVGFKQIPYLFERPSRAAGETKYTAKKLLALAQDAIVSFSNKLLKMPLPCALFSTFLALVFLILSICKKTLSNTIILFFISLFCIMVFMCLYIVGIYLTRINNKLKNRQRYVIAEKVNFEEE